MKTCTLRVNYMLQDVYFYILSYSNKWIIWNITLVVLEIDNYANGKIVTRTCNILLSCLVGFKLASSRRNTPTVTYIHLWLLSVV